MNSDIVFDSLSHQIRDSFLGHVAQRQLFPAGTSLIRVVSLGSNSFMGSYCVTEYYYDQIKKYAAGRKISVQQGLRECLAILSRFSPDIDLAVAISLGHPTYGFVGQANSQVENKSLYFPGGCEQIFIPNLTKGFQNRVKIFEHLHNG